MSIERAAALVAALVLLALAQTASPFAGAGVVLNEILYDPAGADAGGEFVEIMNCGPGGVLLTGWVLESGNGAGPDDWTVEWIGGEFDYLEPGGILVVGEDGVVPPPSYVTSLDLQNGPDGVRLTDGERVVDVVGWGEPLFAEYCEGHPCVDVVSGSSLARLPDCFDSNENDADFTPCPAPTPGARNAAPVDLSIDLADAGRVIFEPGSTVRFACRVRNVGSLTIGESDARLELSVDGEPAALLAVPPMAPRDSLVLVLDWAPATAGYHRADARLDCPEDAEADDNSDSTTVTVGGPGGIVALNEIMHSPTEEQTEWVEFRSLSPHTIVLASWSLGDDIDAHAIETREAAVAALEPRGFLVAARDRSLVPADSILVVETDGWEALSATDVVVLLDRFGTIIDRVAYERSWGGSKGVSLERVRPEMPSQEPCNWGGSVSPEGGTPGRTNSIHVATLPSDGRLSAAPNPFSPDGDGRDDRVVVRFDLPVPTATARLTVYDLDGRMRALLADHARVSGTTEILWDGRGLDGEPLPAGLYVLALEAINAREGVFVRAKEAVGIVR